MARRDLLEGFRREEILDYGERAVRESPLDEPIPRESAWGDKGAASADGALEMLLASLEVGHVDVRKASRACGRRGRDAEVSGGGYELTQMRADQAVFVKRQNAR